MPTCVENYSWLKLEAGAELTLVQDVSQGASTTAADHGSEANTLKSPCVSDPV